MNLKRWKWSVIAVLGIGLFVHRIGDVTASTIPYPGYIYNDEGKAVQSRIAYTPLAIISGSTLGIEPFDQPRDLFVASDSSLYILDSGRSRILVVDQQFELVKTIQGEWNQPQGIFVTDDGHIFVADTEHRRIVELDPQGKPLREINDPTSEVLKQDFSFFPTKVAVDRAKRMYVVARGVFDGLIEFDADGEFTAFVGAPRVKFNPIDVFWKRIATKEQRERMALSVPTEFNSVDIDDSGFTYTTTKTVSQKPIQKLNALGINILKENGYHPPVGDLEYNYMTSGSSIFNDIAVGDYGIYSVLDSRKGRIFTYDEEGSLLYIFGGLGQQVGTFRNPVAIDHWGDYFVVLDRDLNQVTVFEPTPFGTAVNEGIHAQYHGKFEEAFTAWNKVLRLDANYEQAYVGIGKSLYRNDQYQEAMKYFKKGHDRKYYSKAFTQYRKALFREYSSGVLTTVVSLPVLYFIMRWVRKRIVKRKHFGL